MTTTGRPHARASASLYLSLSARLTVLSRECGSNEGEERLQRAAAAKCNVGASVAF